MSKCLDNNPKVNKTLKSIGLAFCSTVLPLTKFFFKNAPLSTTIIMCLELMNFIFKKNNFSNTVKFRKTICS
jgi:hypothetical protein